MIENPNVQCSVPRTNLTLADLDKDFWDITDYDNIGLPLNYHAREAAVLEVPDHGYKRMMIDGYHATSGDVVNSWKGRAAQGVLFIEDIERKGAGPWTSELCKVAYEQVANLATLNRIFVTNVINSDTRPFAKNVWPGPGLKVFEAGTRQFHTLLGTRIGKLVAYLVLGAYGQGNRRIARIAVWWAGQTNSVLQLRFDLE